MSSELVTYGNRNVQFMKSRCRTLVNNFQNRNVAKLAGIMFQLNRSFRIYSCLILLILCSLLGLPLDASASERVALVIGNGAYQYGGRMLNPSNDAHDMAALLKRVGFDVIEGEDLGYSSMLANMSAFATATTDSKVAFFYYSGHGMQVGGENYLIPVDAKLEDRTAIEYETINVTNIFRYMVDLNRTSIAFIDADRDNPLASDIASTLGVSGSTGAGAGLAAPRISGGGLLIGFSTSAGMVAYDGEGRNSPYTSALLRELPTPGVEIQQLMTRVKADVFDMTKGEQEPSDYSSLRQEFFMIPGVLSNEVTCH